MVFKLSQKEHILQFCATSARNVKGAILILRNAGVGEGGGLANCGTSCYGVKGGRGVYCENSLRNTRKKIFTTFTIFY